MKSLANLETEEVKRRPRMHQHRSLAVDKKDTLRILGHRRLWTDQLY
ncbi:hypothetical protein FOQG_03219 [Fusarium oxysporum f. sp. raphani 54005]|uniref:Uncharacterized protein n=3 Tax=Fusarium oxysporum TaxID=5507 RepID=X0CYT9_FUSOX